MIDTIDDEPPKDVRMPSDVPKIKDFVPVEIESPLVREELDDVLRGHMKNRKKLSSFAIHPETKTLKDLLKETKRFDIGIRDVIKGIRIKPKDV